MGVRDVVYESDSKIVLDALNVIRKAPVAIENIVGGIRIKLQHFRHVKISNVRPNDNFPAHLLAWNMDIYVIWLEKNPNMVESTLVHIENFLEKKENQA